jgi:hypothetical protein
MSIETSLEADTQFAETGKPCMGAFDNPAMAAELFAALDTAIGDTRDDAGRVGRSGRRLEIGATKMHSVQAEPAYVIR